jgi:hypothetical protein
MEDRTVGRQVTAPKIPLVVMSLLDLPTPASVTVITANATMTIQRRYLAFIVRVGLVGTVSCNCDGSLN